MKLLEAALHGNDSQQSGRHLQNQVSPDVLPRLSQLQDHLCHQNKAGQRIPEPRGSNTRGAKGQRWTEPGWQLRARQKGTVLWEQKPPEETSRMSDTSESTKRRYKYSFLVTATLRKHRDTLRMISSCDKEVQRTDKHSILSGQRLTPQYQLHPQTALSMDSTKATPYRGGKHWPAQRLTVETRWGVKKYKSRLSQKINSESGKKKMKLAYRDVWKYRDK